MLKNRLKKTLTVDCVVFGPQENENLVLLIQRGKAPFKGKWALPGGFLEEGEELEDCARRELKEETGLTNVFLKQFHTFSKLSRDPRGHVITTAYYAVVRPGHFTLKATEDAKNARWFPLEKIPPLAFDHDKILKEGIKSMRQKIIRSSSIFEILPASFSLTQLQQSLEVLLKEKLDKRNFRKKILSYSFLEDTGERTSGLKQRPAMLYRFKKKNFKKEFEEDLRLNLI